MIDPSILENSANAEGADAGQASLSLRVVPVFEEVLGAETLQAATAFYNKNPYDIPDYSPTPLPDDADGHVTGVEQMQDLSMHWQMGFGAEGNKKADQLNPLDLQYVSLGIPQTLLAAEIISEDQEKELTAALEKYFSETLYEQKDAAE